MEHTARVTSIELVFTKRITQMLKEPGNETGPFNDATYTKVLYR